MECNRDEATRAKEIAEKKFAAKDITGAKKFAMKANALFPELEGLQKMVSTLDVYISAERKINGETDWYAVLDVDPKADDETVRKHYRKLALMLHPDKNKSIGAEGAFKLISESWSMLSDKARRSLYDHKRRTRITPTKVPSSNVQKNGFPDISVPKTHNSKGNSNNVPPSSSPKEKSSFWTVCQRCKMQYEYLRIYLNHNLLCPKCQQPFIAIETPAPSKRSKVHNQNKHSYHQGSTSTVGGESNTGTNFQWVPFTGPAPGASTSAEAAASMVHNAYEQVKRQRKEAQAAKRKKSQSKLPTAKRRKGAEAAGAGTSGVKKGISELSNVECQSLLMEKGKKLIKKKLKDMTQAKTSESVEKMSKKRDDVKGKRKVLEKKEPREEITMEISDPDFYFFDKDRVEKCFMENQVWAVYGDDDYMPRHYAMINSVISLNPFKVNLTWLKPNLNNEKSIWHFATSGLRKTCGDFRLGKFEDYSALNSFSHKVSSTKSDEDERIIQIFPRKGDIWATYRNWSPQWNDMTSTEVIKTFDVVELLEDYNDNIGVIVIPLVKVAGFKTVFRRHLDPDKEIVIPKEEMARLSHQVPAHLLNSHDAPFVFRGCWELDPAGTPLQLQTIIGKVEELNVENEE
ncbi:uncharacterized protein LOC124911092 [Impatiens glandulifera]|uniref:uncharacterized protein LOC124911092 n=1 Tax=Impatiens glandulifera TaxID=253017 RepID=UPI001FB0F324|nr:uncharacterized protein LOC124911092 [Impatiens glandulifera]